ncbi:MAG: transglutaminase family protein [Sporichthyaceae bacterium]
MTILDTRTEAAPDVPVVGRIPADARRIAFSVVATLLSAVALLAMLKSGAWLPKSLAVVVALFAVGVGLRYVRVPRPVVVLVQAAVGLCIVVAMQARTDATANFVPGPGALEDLADQWNDGIGELTRFQAPSVATLGLTTVLLLCLAGAAIVVDALSVSYRRPDLAGLALVIFFAIPHVTLENGWRGAWFVLLALGFLLLAFDGNSDRVRTWGEDTVVDSGAGGSRTLKIGGSILVLSLAIPAALPSLTGDLFKDSGIGYTPPEPIETLDPLRVMRDYLVRPTDDQLFTMNTDSAWPDEAYVQSVVLDVFTGRQWKAGNRDVNTFEALVPDSSGTEPSIPTAPFRAEFKAGKDFSADYVGMPRPVVRVDIEGKWRLVPTTSDVLSFDGRPQIGGKSWTVEGYDRDPVAKDIQGQVGAEVPGLDRYLELPKLPASIAAEAKRITKGAKGSVEIGRKLQDYFANPKNTTYTLQPAGSGTDAIVLFLKSKRGYAEQTAATMAVMARTLGVPARLGVGFTAGQSGGIDRAIGAHDAHAWPELFLPEVGWTRFEPTPARAPGQPRPLHWLAPGVEKVPPKPDENESTPPPPAPQPQAPQPQPEPPPPGDQPREVPKDEESNTALAVMLWSLLVLLLLAAPRLARAAVTRHRWVRAKRSRTFLEEGVAGTALPASTVTVRTAWFELRDSAIDLGYAWPATRTPRQAGQELTERAHLTPDTVADLDRLLAVVEQLRYAPPAQLTVDAFAMRTAVLKTRREMSAAATRTDRVRGFLLPRSLVPLLRAGAAAVVGRVAALRPRPARRATGRRRAGVKLSRS